MIEQSGESKLRTEGITGQDAVALVSAHIKWSQNLAPVNEYKLSFLTLGEGKALSVWSVACVASFSYMLCCHQEYPTWCLNVFIYKSCHDHGVSLLQ